MAIPETPNSKEGNYTMARCPKCSAKATKRKPANDTAYYVCQRHGFIREINSPRMIEDTACTMKKKTTTTTTRIHTPKRKANVQSMLGT